MRLNVHGVGLIIFLQDLRFSEKQEIISWMLEALTKTRLLLIGTILFTVGASILGVNLLIRLRALPERYEGFIRA